MINEDEKRRAEIFLERKTIVHVSRKDGIYFNGLLQEVGSDFFIIRDRIENKNQIIFFSELKKPLEEFINDKGV